MRIDFNDPKGARVLSSDIQNLDNQKIYLGDRIDSELRPLCESELAQLNFNADFDKLRWEISKHPTPSKLNEIAEAHKIRKGKLEKKDSKTFIAKMNDDIN